MSPQAECVCGEVNPFTGREFCCPVHGVEVAEEGELDLVSECWTD